ncbi:MAG: response regulator [Fuerstiella sp.]|nr:response regulator [Fuerstiella sp.]MCP4856564.1 response regulator [Fuerstiella sp.]
MATVPVIFVVEDDPAVRTAIAMLLRQYDYDVRTYDSAESFLEVYEETDSACLVSDIRMPGMSGLDLLINLKQQESLLPVVLYSGYADSAVVIEAKKQGVIAVLAKPVGANTLHAAVRQALRSDPAEPVSD